MRFKEYAIIALCLVVISAIGTYLLFTTHQAEIWAGVSDFFSTLRLILLVIVTLAIFFGAYGAWRFINREARLIRPGKYGPAQGMLKRGGEIYEFAMEEEAGIVDAAPQFNQMDLTAILEQHQKLLQFSKTAVSAYKQIAPEAEANQITEPVQKPLALPAPREIPAPYDLVDIFRHMDITPENVFLAIDSDGQYLTVDSAKQLCHGVFNAVTGRGKTIVERGIEAQLLYCGHEVVHCDIKFSLIDEKGLDYRPIARRLLQQEDMDVNGVYLPHLILNVTEILAYVNFLANVEIPRRLEMFHAGNHTYSTLYVFLEEFIYLVKKYPEIGPLVEEIIIVGRSLGIKLFTAAQNFLARDTKLSGAMRENFETAYYLGGDDTSGAVILDVSTKHLREFLYTHRITLGEGLTMLRNNAVAPDAKLARVGMASNDAIYYLLGRADNFQLPAREQIVDTPPPFQIVGRGKQEKPVDPEHIEFARENRLSDRALAEALVITQYEANKVNRIVKEQARVNG